MIRLTAVLSLIVIVFAGTPAMPQTSPEDAITAQYPKGSVFIIQADGFVGTDGTCMLRPVMSFKNGKLHAPSFMQNAVLATAKCTSQPLPAGVQVTLAQVVVKLKNGKVDFVLLACSEANCTLNNSYKTQVTFEFPKGILEASGLPVVQEAVGHVLASASADPSAAAAAAPPPVQPAAVSAHGEPLYSYVSAQSPSDRLDLFQDGAFALFESGQNYTGTYEVSGTTLNLHLAELRKDVEIAMKEKQLVVNGNETWSMEAPDMVSAQNSGPAVPPSLDRIGQAVNEFIGQLKQKGSISAETTAILSTAPVTLVNSSAGSTTAEAIGIFELKNASYTCKSDESGTKSPKKKPAYVLSARVTEKQAGHWFLTSAQMTVRECTPNPTWDIEIPVP